MKNIYSKLVLVSLLLVVAAGPVSAREYMGKKTNAKSASVRSKAAACKRAQSTAELNINNVRALINGYGNMWYDGSVAQYHLPKNGTASPLYCAALWIGGTDVNDQLRLAALKFGQGGDDFWPGPLKVNGTASIDLPVCNAYDRHWIITKAEVATFMSHFKYDTNNVVTQLSDPSEDITDVIRNWPAKGEGDDLTNYLAPFYDADGDRVYDPQKGDYPYYDFDNELCPRFIKLTKPWLSTTKFPSYEETYDKTIQGSILSDQVLKGDQTIWWVFNDMGNTHTETGGQPIGLEIRAQAFAFSTNDDINNMTFYSYEIINRSTYELRETYFSQWVDPDLGNAQDDYVGCDVRRGLGYCYNGTATDQPGSTSYQGIPPAVGIDFFQGPYMDPDGKDNPKIDIAKIQRSNNQQMLRKLSEYEIWENGVFKGYDTIQISYDAGDFSWEYWYFVPGDEFGNCAINGVNFGNGIVDDERFGMRRFVYYNNDDNQRNGEPSKASDYYYYLRGYWKNGQRMKFGGNALQGGTNVTSLDCDFMFPGDSDPWNWGTNGVDPGLSVYGSDGWTEKTSGNAPGDRRFMQSAGPFTLKPGALNYITVGIPFAQATSGNEWSSVVELRRIDDVCQKLFENCFKVIDGPDAPTLLAQELSNEVILYLKYESTQSNNYGESYSELDPAIPTYYTVVNDAGEDEQVYYPKEALYYKFEGYQIYQLKDALASVADINDPTKAVLVAQCDIENYYDSLNADGTVNANPQLPIGTLVNFVPNSATNIISGSVMVQGANKGIQHAFRITKDAFATGTNTNLVNNKEYYFVAIAYAHNRYKEYSQKDAAFLDGQSQPYLAGRKNEYGSAITPITVIPHSVAVEDGGKMAQAAFGMSPNVIRLGGYGNGGFQLRLDESSIEELMGVKGQEAKGPGIMEGSLSNAGLDQYAMTNPCILPNPVYKENNGPIDVRVIDPLKIKEGRFSILFNNKMGGSLEVTGDTRWCIVREDGQHLDSVVTNGVVERYIDTVYSDFAIARYNEQLFLDLGIAVSLSNPAKVATDLVYSSSSIFRIDGGIVNNGALLGSDMTFEKPTMQWLSGIPDNDSYMMYNWIRSGAQYALSSYSSFMGQSTPYNLSEPYLDEDYFRTEVVGTGLEARLGDIAVDKDQVFEDVVSGLWAPYALTSTLPFHPAFNYSYYLADQAVFDSIGAVQRPAVIRDRLMREMMVNVYNKSLNYNDMSHLPSVRIVFTNDVSKWTRCPVIEMCDDHLQAEGQARRFSARRHKSVDKNGDTLVGAATAADLADPTSPAYISEYGMGWFPGYAINTVTGERLNIMFGEDSRFAQHHGRDMMWNPVSTMMEGTENYVMGGRHFIYVMNANKQPFYNMVTQAPTMTYYTTPSYDAGRWAMQMLSSVDRMMKASVKMSFDFMKNGIVNTVDNFIPVRDSIAMLYASVAWVNMPLVSSRFQFENPKDIPCDAFVNIDVRAPYGVYMAPNMTTSTSAGVEVKNREMPAYQFIFSESDAVRENLAFTGNARQEYIDSLLNLINVVPNPYYSYSNYETSSQLDTRVRIVNLPTGMENGVKQGCTIRIYTVDGTLVRTLGPTAVERDASIKAESTTVDWDLHNQTGIPIAGGMYLIHVTVPGLGERVIKWFGTMRPVDLNSFQF